jgi:hypothetical protein
MLSQSLRRKVSLALATIFLSFGLVTAQEPPLRITRPQDSDKPNLKTTATLELEKDTAFRRLNNEESKSELNIEKKANGKRSEINKANTLKKVRTSAQVPDFNQIESQSFSTGGGDITEIEPNGTIAQAVSLPVNIFGQMGFDSDIDFFAFQGLAGQPIVIEPFATRLRRSDMIADIALFNSTGQLLVRSIGDENDDPLIRFTPSTNEVLVIGIADVDDFGGSSYQYVLNITRGVDVSEQEPNDQQAQSLTAIPATVFGDITVRTDIDFYSFIGQMGETLIVDVDAEVLGSRLDPEINLSDPQTGAEFFYNDEYDGSDSRFNIVLPYTGRYVIGIGSFQSNSTGFYRLNISAVSGNGAPIITSVTRTAKKQIEIVGTGFNSGVKVEVNSVRRKTTIISNGVLHAKVKARVGDVVTVVNSPDDRRSNLLVIQ